MTKIATTHPKPQTARAEQSSSRTKKPAKTAISVEAKIDARRRPTRSGNGKKVTPPPPRETKLSSLVAMLREKRGASLDRLMKATGWQKHSVRGAISGALKKKLGLKVLSEKSEAGRIYRIVG